MSTIKNAAVLATKKTLFEILSRLYHSTILGKVAQNLKTTKNDSVEFHVKIKISVTNLKNVISCAKIQKI